MLYTVLLPLAGGLTTTAVGVGVAVAVGVGVFVAGAALPSPEGGLDGGVVGVGVGVAVAVGVGVFAARSALSPPRGELDGGVVGVGVGVAVGAAGAGLFRAGGGPPSLSLIVKMIFSPIIRAGTDTGMITSSSPSPSVSSTMSTVSVA